MAEQSDNIVVPIEATPDATAPETTNEAAPETTIEATTTELTTATATEKVSTTAADSSADPDPLSQKVTLADLCAKGTALYTQKKYEAASEQYGRAAELQAEINGELNPENADVLFLYGRSVFRLGQAKSDVIGGKAPEKKEEKKQEEKNGSIIGDSIKASADKGSLEEEAKAKLEQKKPLFQFTGDENFDDSDENEEEGEGEEEEEDDDLAVAFEVLDLSRVLFGKQLTALLEEKANKKENEKHAAWRHVVERLGDVHDLLGEISLENERYSNATVDARESLNYKKQLHPEESEIIAEAHFKLSLALEFASITSTAGEDGQENVPQQIDQKLRDEAVKELEAALNSTKMKVAAKERELAELVSPEENEISHAQITEGQEIIADMEQRLVDLRGPPIDLNSVLSENPLGGILSTIAGTSKEQAQAVLEEAKKGARDLSGLVKKKEKVVTEAAQKATETAVLEVAPVTGKRKAENLEVEMEEKRARTEELVEEEKKE